MAMHFVLSTGGKIPAVGLGTWQSAPGAVGDAVYAAVKAGYRHIDCARDYGNEEEVTTGDLILFRVMLLLVSLPTSAVPGMNWRQAGVQNSLVLSLESQSPSGGSTGTSCGEPTELSMCRRAHLSASGYSVYLCASFFLLGFIRFWIVLVQVGLALKKLFEEGVVKREDLFITSKLWCDHHAAEDVPEALKQSLDDLQLEYLDLYLIHWPFKLKKGTSLFNPENYVAPDIAATWGAMEKLYDAGKARAIGVSNFSCKKLGDLLVLARVYPAVNQVECHPGWDQTKLHDFCRSTGVHLSAYSPLGSPGTAWVNRNVLKEPAIITIAEKLGKTPAQVALRWNIQMGHSVLPKSVNEEKIKENLDVFDWSIPNDLLAKFSEIEQERLLKGQFFVNPQSVYKTLEELWDGEI
ncbi:hypothetical protein ACP4OV_019695 [Aristida adscensionis]